jgi:hypothetical protein
MSDWSEVQEATDSARVDPPQPGQLALLRKLSGQLGESFSYPHTEAEASAEIERLEGREPDSYAERRLERLQVGRDMARRGRDAASVRDWEIAGDRSSARWRYPGRGSGR